MIVLFPEPGPSVAEAVTNGLIHSPFAPRFTAGIFRWKESRLTRIAIRVCKQGMRTKREYQVGAKACPDTDANPPSSEEISCCPALWWPMIRCLLAAWLISSLVTFSGFCWAELGWTSNRELIEAAFRHELEGGWSNDPAVGDVSAYVAEYPQCCSVRSSEPMPVLNAIFFRRFYEVTIKYPVADPAENQGEPFYESILTMDCCARDVADRYGMGSSVPVPRGKAKPRGPRSKGPAY